MNVYDFDHTIYAGDSTIDFYFFCLRRHFGLLRFCPTQFAGLLQYKLGKVTKTQFKEKFFSFLKGIRDPKQEIEAFWERKKRKIRPWYIRQRQQDDVVISASPEFLLCPICKELSVYCIASRVDWTSGKFLDENCHGEQKPIRFHEEFPNSTVDRFYSDSLSDTPMAALSAESFLVCGDQIRAWPK